MGSQAKGIVRALKEVGISPQTKINVNTKARKRRAKKK